MSPGESNQKTPSDFLATSSDDDDEETEVQIVSTSSEVASVPPGSTSARVSKPSAADAGAATSRCSTTGRDDSKATDATVVTSGDNDNAGNVTSKTRGRRSALRGRKLSPKVPY